MSRDQYTFTPRYPPKPGQPPITVGPAQKDNKSFPYVPRYPPERYPVPQWSPLRKSPEVEMKTPRVINEFNSVARPYTTGTNPLNDFRSYTYNFTLAAVKDSALKTFFSTEQGLLPKDYFVVAKSSGKGTAGFVVDPVGEFKEVDLGFNPDESQAAMLKNRQVIQHKRKEDSAKLVDRFNKESAGRFDFYINNVSINTIQGGSQKTNMSHSTSIEFDIFESYSLTGFIEAIHVASVAAGYQSYVNTPFMMKMEFIGYKDDDSDVPIKIENSTRYFLFRFVGLDVDVDQEGTRYRCKGVPFNELALSVSDVLKTDLPVKGYQVGPILENLMENLTESMRLAAIKENNENKFDSYSVVFPKITETGIDTTYLTDSKNYDRNQIAKETLMNVLKDNGIYKFPTPITTPEDFKRFATNPDEFLFQFSKGSNVSDCVQSVIRDSTFTKNILKNLTIDEYGLLDYFFVHVESEKKEFFDEKNNKDCYHYRFVVIPFKIHYTRVIPRENTTVDTTKLKDIIHRKYEYFYTGKNLDILKFDLKFNSLFYQAMPMALGNITGRLETSGSQPDEKSLVSLSGKADYSPLGAIPTQYSPDNQGSMVSGMANANGTSSDPYDYLAKGLHDAIIQNVDQTQAEIQIIGDPYYLCTMGMGNIKHQINPDGTVGLKEAPIYFGDVHILIQFRNPKDRGNVLGVMEFDSRVALYSGLFRLLELRSDFKDGQFTQNLKLVRMPMQPEDTNLNGDIPTGSPLEAEPNTETSPVEAEKPAPSGIRPDENELLKTVFNFSTPGLPGVLSNLVAGASSVAGALAGGLAVGSLANNVFSGVTGAVTAVGSIVNQVQGQTFQGLSNIGSAIRLASSGLSNFSENINSVGGQINQVSKTLNTVGASSITPSNLSNGLAAANLGNFKNLSNQAMSAVDSLKDKAGGLVSEISSKADGISGKANALASQLGIDINKIAGLGSDLQTKLTEQFNTIAKSIPESVDLNLAVERGLNLNNIPASNLSKIPATQPFAVSPPPLPNLSDIGEILKRGGNLDNLPGAASISGIGSLISSLKNEKSFISNPLDSSVVSQKLVSVQKGLSDITGKIPSVEAGIAVVESMVSSQIPNITSAPKSVINVFGSNSSKESPLRTAIFINSSEKV